MNLTTIKKNVLSIDGPGQSLTMPASEGIITNVENSFFGAFADVTWTQGEKAGQEERLMLSSIKTELKGCGVYYA